MTRFHGFPGRACRYLIIAAAWIACTTALDAEPPAGYYDTVDLSSPPALQTSLHEIIDDHIRTPLSSPNSWLILESAEQDPNDPDQILDIYKNQTYLKVGGGTGGYEREHTWPQSYGFPKDTGSGRYPRSDYHALFLADGSYNGSRGFTLYRTCAETNCAEWPTLFNNGRGGGAGVYPGNSNWRRGTGATGTWETWIGRRGEVARALFYLDTRYDGSDHADGSAEPNLVLTNDPLLIASDSATNKDPAYMGILSVLLKWHYEDPVDEVERGRHEAIFAAQGNRNPFIDHPEWVACVYQGVCGADTALLLNGGRFKITALWTTSQGTSGLGRPQQLTNDTGYFWFFADTNVEVVIKVLNGCVVNDRFWVFAGGLTNVEVMITIEDTKSGQVRRYTNSQGAAFRPIQDTNAFSTCP